jgi:hypothetical protein
MCLRIYVYIYIYMNMHFSMDKCILCISKYELSLIFWWVSVSHVRAEKHACIHVCTHVCNHACGKRHACICACMYASMYVRMHAWTPHGIIWTHNACLYVYTHTCVHAYTQEQCVKHGLITWNGFLCRSVIINVTTCAVISSLTIVSAKAVSLYTHAFVHTCAF